MPSPKLVRLTADSPFAPNCARPETGTLQVGTEVEPHLAISPDGRMLTVAWQQDRWSNGGARALLTRTSFDGGRTWSRTTAPPFSQCAGGNTANGGDFARAADPWVAYGRDGELYLTGLAFDAEPQRGGVSVATSWNGGKTWGPVTALAFDTDPLAFNDKETLAADPVRSGHAYAVWTRFYFGPDETLAPLHFARTTTSGKKWSSPRAIFEPGPNVSAEGPVALVSAGGDILIGFSWIGPNHRRVALLRSEDRGTTWSAEPTVVADFTTTEVTDPADGSRVRTGGLFPAFAVDGRPGNDRVYAAWQTSSFSQGELNQIAFASSVDGGRSWSAPALVSPKDSAAFTPSLAVDSHGRVTLTYYDAVAAGDAGTSALATQYWLIQSTDGGRSFSERRHSPLEPFDLRQAPDANGYFLGDYMGLAASQSISTVFVATGCLLPGSAARESEASADLWFTPVGNWPAAPAPSAQQAPPSAPRVELGR